MTTPRTVPRIRSGEVKRRDYATAARSVSIICGGIGALAVYVQTVNGMEWRCERCGARVKVVA